MTATAATTTTERMRRDALLRAESRHRSAGSYVDSNQTRNSPAPLVRASRGTPNAPPHNHMERTSITAPHCFTPLTTTRVPASSDLPYASKNAMEKDNAHPGSYRYPPTPDAAFMSPRYTTSLQNSTTTLSMESSLSTTTTLPPPFNASLHSTNGSNFSSHPSGRTTSRLEPPDHDGSLLLTDRAEQQQQQQQQQLLDCADAARAEWRRYGPNRTQALEEMRISGPMAVRVVGAESRVDLCGAEYTVYLVHVVDQQQQQQQRDARTNTFTAAADWTSNQRATTPTAAPSSMHTNNISSSTTTGQWTIERRYSDFCKLAAVLPNLPDCPFPAKHWAGRLGSWTPARTWAQWQYATLIQERQVQLDAWLVHVVMMHCAAAHSHATTWAMAHTTVGPTRTTTISLTTSQQQAIHDFLTLQQSAPPCTTPACRGNKQCVAVAQSRHVYIGFCNTTSHGHLGAHVSTGQHERVESKYACTW
jgi:PX domain